MQGKRESQMYLVTLHIFHRGYTCRATGSMPNTVRVQQMVPKNKLKSSQKGEDKGRYLAGGHVGHVRPCFIQPLEKDPLKKILLRGSFAKVSTLLMLQSHACTKDHMRTRVS